MDLSSRVVKGVENIFERIRFRSPRVRVSPSVVKITTLRAFTFACQKNAKYLAIFGTNFETREMFLAPIKKKKHQVLL